MKNTWIQIKSQGEIEMNALRLLGASTKRSDTTKIGFFGSGLKYTMAILLRRSIPFVIYQGERKIEITTKPGTLREQEFDLIVIDGQETSMTTAMGVDWEPWMAIRETYSNALDEPNCTLTNLNEEPIGEPGWTTIGIYLDDHFTDFCESPGDFFADFLPADDLMYQSELGTLYRAHKTLTIYRKGIRAHFEEAKALFKYDFPKVELTETRTLKHSWYVKQNDIPGLLSSIEDRAIVGHILNQIMFSDEINGDWNTTFNQAWLDEIGDRVVIISGTEPYVKEYLAGPHIILPEKMVTGLRRSFPDIRVAGQGKGNYKYLVAGNLSARHEGILEAARLFMEDSGNPITYPVTVVDFFEKNIMGLAVKGKIEKVLSFSKKEDPDVDPHILIARLTLERGMKETVCTLVEEQCHLESQEADETRGFQDYLIRRYVSALEEKLGRFL